MDLQEVGWGDLDWTDRCEGTGDGHLWLW